MNHLFKRIILALALLAVAFSASAQQESVSASSASEFKHHELRFAYGFATHKDVLSVLGNDIFGNVFRVALSSDEVTKSHYTGSFSLEYYYNFNKVIGFGAVIGFEYISYDYVNNKTDVKSMTEKDYYISIMPALKAHWFSFPYVSMYSKFGLGLDIDHSTYKLYTDAHSAADKPEGDDYSVAFQLSPICIEVGLVDYKAFAEFGYGTQGCITVGLRARF